MKLKNIFKIIIASSLLILALGITGYAASVTSVTGTDGTNTFQTSAGAVTAVTPLRSTLNVSGMVDTAEANVTIMISAEDTIVYVNQTVADSEGTFEFDFPVVLEGGYTYEVKVNTENSATAKTMYFKSEAKHYGDLTGDEAIKIGDSTQLARYLVSLRISDTVKANIEAGLADLTGDGAVKSGDLTQLLRYLAQLGITDTAKERTAWYVRN